MFDPNWIYVLIGEILIAIGVLCDVMAAIGFHRLPNFYCKLHSLTLGSIGGAVVPLIGVSILSLGCDFLGIYKLYIAGGSLITALMILIVAPIGSHAIARASYRSGVEEPWPITLDMLAEKIHGKQEASETR